MPMRITRLAGELQVPPAALLSWLAAQGHGRYAREDQQLPDDLARLARARVRDIVTQARAAVSMQPAPGAGGPAAPPATPPRPARSLEDSAADVDLLAAAFADVRPLAGRPAPTTTPPRRTPGPPPPSAHATVGSPTKAAPERRDARPPDAAMGPPVAGPTARLTDGASRPAASLAYVQTLEARIAALEDALRREEVARARDAEASALAAAASAQEVAALTTRAVEAESACEHLREALSAATADARAQRPVTLRALLEARGLVGDDEIHLAFRALGEARLAAELAGAVSLASPGDLAELLSLRLSLRARGEPPPARGTCAVVEVPAERADTADTAPAVARLSTACLVTGARAIAWVGGAPHHHRVLRERLDPRIRLHTFGPDRLPHATLAVDARFVWDPARRLSVPGGVTLTARTFGEALDQAARALSRGDGVSPS